MMIINHLSGSAIPESLRARFASVLPGRIETMTTVDLPQAPNPLLDIFGGGEASASGSIAGSSPWYSTWWGVALIVGGAYGGYRYFSAKKQAKQA